MSGAPPTVQMTIEVHAPMQDADDIDLAAGKSIEQEVRANGEPVVTRANIVAGAAPSWIDRDRLDGGLELTQVNLGLIDAPPR